MPSVLSSVLLVGAIIGGGTLIILLLMSYSSLEVNEIALDYSTISKSVGKKTYYPGIHFLGIGHHFVRYPKTVLTIDFSNEKKKYDGHYDRAIESRTMDGLNVVIEISFQYMFIPERLYDLYITYGEGYPRIFQTESIDILTEITTKYTAYQFFYDRALVSNSMKDALSFRFKQCCFATLELFQLRAVNLPSEFEKAIQQTEVIKQDITTAKVERESIIVELDTRVKNAQYDYNITINKAKGDASKLLFENDGNIRSFNITQENKIAAYKALKNGLLLNSTQLIEYIKAKLIHDYKNQQNIYVQMDRPI